MEPIISNSILILCKNTTINELLLLDLCQQNVMMEHTKDQINAQATNLEKASAFYTYMKTRPVNNLPLLIKALQDSGNDLAAEMLSSEPIPLVATAQGSGSTGSVTQGSGNQSSVNLPKIKTFEVANVINRNGRLCENWHSLVEPMEISAADGVQLNIRFKDNPREGIKNLLNHYVNRKGRQATTNNLAEIFEENDFGQAAILLKEAYPVDHRLTE